MYGKWAIEMRGDWAMSRVQNIVGYNVYFRMNRLYMYVWNLLQKWNMIGYTRMFHSDHTDVMWTQVMMSGIYVCMYDI